MKVVIDIIRVKKRKPHAQDYKKYYIPIQDKEMFKDIIELLVDAGYRHGGRWYRKDLYQNKDYPGCGLKNCYFDGCVVTFNPQVRTLSVNRTSYCTKGRNYCECYLMGNNHG